MNNFSVKIGDSEYWISRSVAAAGFILRVTSDNDLYILACKRSDKAADYHGYWCCPCGYLDYNETVKQCCAREIYEETGFSIRTSRLNLFNIQDDPRDSIRQNITLKYYGIVHISVWDDDGISNPPLDDEISEVAWIPINKVDEFQWAFGHKEIILDLVDKYMKNTLCSDLY